MPQAKSCRIVFMGTPELAAVVLRRLADWPGGEVLAVYTQPDRPAGRGQKLRPSPVKEAALELGLPVTQEQVVLAYVNLIRHLLSFTVCAQNYAPRVRCYCTG